MTNLMLRHNVLVDLIGGKKVQYLDIPVHNNIGDLLIYLGTLEFFKKKSIDVSYTSGFFNYSRQYDDSVILLHGGGNFGDLYPKHQYFRERIISQHPNNRIIVLPQTLHFEHDSSFQRAKRVISSHPDIFICARDKKSLEIAKNLGGTALLMPDMAHQLYPVERTLSSPKKSMLCVRRSDTESLNRRWDMDIGYDVVDWPSVVGKKRTKFLRFIVRTVVFAQKLGVSSASSAYFTLWWERTARKWVADAVKLIAPYECLTTDRLHAHILACLMDKESIVVDNNYGKNGNYIECWMKDSPLLNHLK